MEQFVVFQVSTKKSQQIGSARLQGRDGTQRQPGQVFMTAGRGQPLGMPDTAQINQEQFDRLLATWSGEDVGQLQISMRESEGMQPLDQAGKALQGFPL